MSSTGLRVCIVDRDSSFAEELMFFLEQANVCSQLKYFYAGLDSIGYILTQRPQVTLLGQGLADISSTGLLRLLRERGCSENIVLFGEENKGQNALEALQGGATGYLEKKLSSKEEILSAIMEVENGGIALSSGLLRKVVRRLYRPRAQSRDECKEPISKREREILYLLSKGCTAKEISQFLSISYHTVRTHQKNLYKKLSVNSIAEALAKYNSAD